MGIDIDVIMKRCPRCQQEKITDAFYHNRNNKDGFSTYCKKCDRVRLCVVKRICAFCQKDFMTTVQSTQTNSGSFCSKSCSGKYRLRRRTDPTALSIKTAVRVRTREFIEKHPELKPTTCPNCKTLREIVAHHDDYEKWNHVRWLCRSCHQKLHFGLVVNSQEMVLQ